jgi:ligand-binding sensor domain-containing protein/signal transduction histidine kinase
MACRVIVRWVGLSLLLSWWATWALVGAGPARASVEPQPFAPQPPDDLRFQRLSLEHGLSQNSVYAILQDQRGFLWFATQDGLNRYDGYDFQVYKSTPGRNSLAHNFVRALVQDPAGDLWIGTDAGGLDRFDPETGVFIHYQNTPGDSHSLSSNHVRALWLDRQGMLWVGSLGGLDRLAPDGDRFVRYPLSNDNVWSLWEDRDGILWVGTEGGLHRLDRQQGTVTVYRHHAADPASLSSDAVWTIYEDHGGDLWVGTADGLNRYDRQRDAFIRYRYAVGDPHSLSHDAVRAIFEDQDGVLWVGSEAGLNRFDRADQRFQRYLNDLSDAQSLSSNWIQAIYQDREGGLWFGAHGGGLSKLDRSTTQFAHYRAGAAAFDSLSSNLVWSILQDSDGVVWVGTGGGGLNKLYPDTGVFVTYRHSNNNPYSLGADAVRAIAQDLDGALWIGTESAGLDRFDHLRGKFIHYRHDPADPATLSHDAIRSLYVDRDGRLWVGTLGGGLDRLDPGSQRFVHYAPDSQNPYSLSDGAVWAIYQDRAGVLWVGAGAGGLNRLDLQDATMLDGAAARFVRYQADSQNSRSLSNNSVLSICEDQAGVLWVGTFGGGLNRFDRQSETFTHYREADGLPNDVVYGILEDEQGYLWLSTNKGLSRFDPRTETFRNFDVGDGLQSNEFNAGAYHKSLDGQMFFGGVNGFNAFYPDELVENTFIPPLVLTRLTQGGVEIQSELAVEHLSEVTLHWPNNFFEFEYAALSYARPDKNRYAYKLEGLDKDWNEVGAQRFGRYTNLPGGAFTLRIRGSNGDGVWNEEGLALRIVVVPPFWERGWFRGGVALLLVGLVVGGYQWRVRGIARRNRELERQVQERTRTLEQRTRESERRQQELEALYRADAELHRRLSLDEVLEGLVEMAIEILRADKSALLTWDAKGERLGVRVARGYRPETLDQMTFAPGEGTPGRVVASGEPVIVQDARADPRISRRATIIEPEHIHSFMQVPIRIGHHIFGVFSADYTRPHAFDENDRRLFLALAQRAALAIDTAQLYERTQELVVLEERQRLARDLHDAVTQTLFSATLIAEALPKLWEVDPDQGRELLGELRQLSRGALAEMRALLLELRPAALIETSLPDLLHQLADAAAGREDIQVQVRVEGYCPLPPDVHVALYRIAQEALNNVVKHAQAHHAVVSLCCQDRRVELEVSDDGCGFDPAAVQPDHLGLGIIRERARDIGAYLAINSQPGQGTTVTAVWTKDQ